MPRVKRRRSRAREGREGDRALAHALSSVVGVFGFSCLRLACHGTNSYPSIGRVRCGFQMGEIKTTARTTERSASIEFDGLDSSMSQHCECSARRQILFQILCPCSSCLGLFESTSGSHPPCRRKTWHGVTPPDRNPRLGWGTVS